MMIKKDLSQLAITRLRRRPRSPGRGGMRAFATAKWLRRSAGARASSTNISFGRYQGFTLLEAMMAVAIFILLISAVASLWIVCYRAAERVSHGGYADNPPNLVLKRLNEAIGASVFHKEPKGLYMWRGSDDLGGGEASRVSFVTAMPPDVAESSAEFAPLERMMLMVRHSGNGNQLVLLAAPFTMNDEEWQRETVLLENVSSFRVRYWDPSRKDWVDRWAEEDRAPTSVQIGILMKGDMPGTNGDWKYHCVARVSKSFDPEVLNPKGSDKQSQSQPPPTK